MKNKNLSVAELILELTKLGEKYDLTRLHISHDISFMDIFGDDKLSKELGVRYVHEQIIVNGDAL